MKNVSNASVRARSADVLRLHFSRVVMLALACAIVPILIFAQDTLPRLSTTLSAMAVQIARHGEDIYELSDYLNAFTTASNPSAATSLVELVLTSLLNTGFALALVQLCQGRRVQGRVLLSHWKHVLGCVGLHLWIAVKTFAWAVPGFLATLLGSMLDSGFLAFVGMILVAALAIPASLRYSMAIYAFSEEPEIGVYDAVERSKQIMAYRKWQRFCLTVPYLLAVIGVMLGFMLMISFFALAKLTGLFMAWLMLVLVLTAAAAIGYFALLAQVAAAGFYEAHKPEPVTDTPAPVADKPAIPEAQPLADAITRPLIPAPEAAPETPAE